MRYSWHSNVTTAYQQVLGQLDQIWDSGVWLKETLPSYSFRVASPKVAEETAISVAAQFDHFMPSHSFKVLHVLHQIWDKNCLLPLQRQGGCLALIDIGCGGGTASAALINLILQLRTRPQDLRLLCIGVDPNTYAIQLYDWMLSNLEATLKNEFEISGRMAFKGIPEALTYVSNGLHEVRTLWKIPHISDLLVIQANVVRPLSAIHEKDVETRRLLRLSTIRGLISDDFGMVEAQAYEQLLSLSDADRMTIMTIATERSEYGDWPLKAKEMGRAIDQLFPTRGHTTATVLTADKPLHVSYENPPESFFSRQGNREDINRPFYVDVHLIQSKNFLSDVDWQETISTNNLELAWYRVRAGLLREALVDEIEIRHFEQNLEANLQRLQDKLSTYTVRLQDYRRFFYQVPKNHTASRPRGLQSIEEEVLAVAAIQVLGKRVSGALARSYAYRLNTRGTTEFLYQHWYRSYRSFRKNAQTALQGNVDMDAVVIRTDIERFFQNIPQEELLENVLKHLRAEGSARSSWLLRQLLVREVTDGFHSAGRGIIQGSIASGFFANLYLLPMDELFGDDFDLAFSYRYVDDILLIVPESIHAGIVLDKLKVEVGKLRLRVSDDKTTDPPLGVEDARKELAQDEDLNKLDQRVRHLTNGLYFTSREYRQDAKAAADNNLGWWRFVRSYQLCLSNIGIYVEETRLSRKLWQYIRKPFLDPRSIQLEFPPSDLIGSPQLWANAFQQLNPKWIKEYLSIKEDLGTLLRESCEWWRQLHQEILLGQSEAGLESKRELKKQQTRINFAVGRLARFGYENVVDVLLLIYREYSFMLRSPRIVLDHIGIQNRMDILRQLILQEVKHADFPGAAYIRAMTLRGLRFIDLPIPRDLITLLERYSTQEGLDGMAISAFERLMATETLLFIRYIPSSLIAEKLQARLLSRLDHWRVEKNIVDLISRTQFVPEISFELLASYEIDQSEYNVAQLSEEAEPEKLRHKYYHSKYPDNADEFDETYL